MPILRWRPVGGDAVVTMDRERVYVGDHSPRIALDSAVTPHGIQQTGLGVSKGTKYTGRIVLAADPGAEVQREPDLGAARE